MLDSVVSYLARSLMLIAGFYLYVFLMSYILPRVLLCRGKISPTDRGLKKYSFSEGRAIVYQPTNAVSPYISQYILSSIQGEKYIQCKIDESITALKYEVQAFDHRHKLMHTVEIEEKEIQNKGYTQLARLNAETSYVNVVLRSVNQTPIRNDNISLIGWIFIGVFVARAVVSTLIMSKIVEVQILKYLQLIYPNGFYTPGPALSRTISFLAGLVYAIFTLLAYYRNEFKSYFSRLFAWLRYQIKSLATRIFR